MPTVREADYQLSQITGYPFRTNKHGTYSDPDVHTDVVVNNLEELLARPWVKTYYSDSQLMATPHSHGTFWHIIERRANGEPWVLGQLVKE